MGKATKYPYILVEGVDTLSLDRCVIESRTVSFLCKMARTSRTLLKTIGYTQLELRKMKVDEEVLKENIARQLPKAYEVYNTVISMIHDGFKQEDVQYKNLISKEGPSQELVQQMYEDLMEKEKNKMHTLSHIICWMRHKPVFHPYLPQLLKRYEQQKQGGAVSEMNQSVWEQLQQMKEIVTSLEVNVQAEQTKRDMSEQLEAKLQQYEKAVVAKEKELKKRDREWQQLQSKLEKEKKQVEIVSKQATQYKKEAGELGKKLGDLRTEADAYKKQVHALEKQVARYEKDAQSMQTKAKQEEEKKWKGIIMKIKVAHEEEIERLQTENELLQKQTPALIIASKQSEPPVVEKEDELLAFFETSEYEPEFV